MRDGIVHICLVLYAALLLYAGFGAPFRDVEDFCNQLSHIAISIALLSMYFVKGKDTQYALINKVTCIVLVCCNVQEMWHEIQKINFSRDWKDFIYPLLALFSGILIYIKWRKPYKN